ncbi:MAG: GIY-YIG nuclease family protein [Nevskia sp.]|nr:GIY-YIG nuclease family protein [Nevskia sp.]
MAFWVYILKCSDGLYYTGHSDNLESRVAQHQHGEIPGFTATRRPVRLVFHRSSRRVRKRWQRSCRSSRGAGRRKRR